MGGLLFKKALRDFWRMGLRTWLIFGVLAIGVAVYAGGFLAQRSVFDTRDWYYEQLVLSDLDLVWKPTDVEDLPAWMQGVLKGDDSGLRALGATQATMRFLSPGAIEVSGDKPVMSLEVYIDPKAPPTVNGLQIIDGRFLSPSSYDEVVVEAAVAEMLGFKVGDTLVLDPYNNAEKVKIVGLARSAEYLLPTANPDVMLPSKGSLVVVYRSLQKFTELFGAPMYNSANLLFEGKGATTKQKQTVIEASAPLVFRTVTDRHGHFSYRFLSEDLKAFGIFIPVLSGIFGIVTFLVLLLSLSRLIAEEQRPIGALLALGRRPREILLAYVGAAAIYGGAAAGLGLCLSPIFGYMLGNGYAHAVGLPPIRLSIVAEPLIVAFALGLSAALVAVIIPALRFVRLTPVSAMRGSDAAQAFRGLPKPVEALIAPLSRSMAARFGLRNILRRPRLTFSVIGLIAMAMALSMAFRYAHQAWVEYAKYAFSHEKWDGIVAFKVPLSSDDATPIYHTKGVDEIRPFVSGFAAICDGPGEEATCLDYRVMGIEATGALRKFRFAEGGSFEDGGEPGIILNRNFNRLHPWTLGATVYLRSGQRTEKVKVTGLTSDMTIGLGYVQLPVAKRLMDMSDKTSGFFATFTEEPRHVKKTLFGHEMVTYVSLKVEMQNLVSQYMEIMRSVIETAILISILMAGLFMLTGLSMAILEREGEYATLRTFGYSDGDVRKMIYVEVAVEAALAVLASVPLSILLGSYLQHAMATAWFEVKFYYQLEPMLRVIVPCLVALPVAAWLPVRKVLRAVPAQLLRARSIG